MTIPERLEEILDKIRDPYWRADHPEVTAAIIGVVTGVIGLFFTFIRVRLIERPSAPAGGS